MGSGMVFGAHWRFRPGGSGVGSGMVFAACFRRRGSGSSFNRPVWRTRAK